MRWRRASLGSDGFTLLEILAALAIVSVIILMIVSLVGNVSHYFDRGARRVSSAESLVLAVDRLADDFGSARFLHQPRGGVATATFRAEPASAEGPAKIIFVGGSDNSGSSTEEVITLTVEEAGEVKQL